MDTNLDDNLDNQLKQIRNAYDYTVEQYDKGIDPYDDIPIDFYNSKEFKSFIADMGTSCSSTASENKKFLDPKSGMNFLDVGSCANLENYRLDKWPSNYYGIDISPKLIEAMENFCKKNNLDIGGLYVADMASLPFRDEFFDIASVIGVLEYCKFGYIEKALQELSRVLKPYAKVILDIPNQNHPDYQIMVQAEAYMGRVNLVISDVAFKKILSKYFIVEKCDTSKVMTKYFLVKKK